MQYHEFLGQVQHRARMATLEDATRATRATLQTLGERLYGGEAENLAAQLPTEIAHYLREAETGHRFGVDEFYKRVSEKECVDLPIAVYHARVVMEVVSEAVSKGVIANVRAQLPPEFAQLFHAGGPGPMPGSTSTRL